MLNKISFAAALIAVTSLATEAERYRATPRFARGSFDDTEENEKGDSYRGPRGPSRPVRGQPRFLRGQAKEEAKAAAAEGRLSMFVISLIFDLVFHFFCFR